jgi:purine nucleoside phosphorylase
VITNFPKTTVSVIDHLAQQLQQNSVQVLDRFRNGHEIEDEEFEDAD